MQNLVIKEEVKVGKSHVSEAVPVDVPNPVEIIQEQPTQAEIEERIWNEIDDDDDDQDHEEAGDNLSQEDQGEPEQPAYEEETKAVEGQILDEATPAEDEKAVEQEGEHQQKTRGYHRGQRRGPRRGGYHYERYENEEHRGRPYRGPRRSQRYRQYRGDRGTGYDNSSGGYYRGYGGGYDKEGDKGHYWNQNKKGKFEKEPDKTVDDDGFFIVKK